MANLRFVAGSLALMACGNAGDDEPDRANADTSWQGAGGLVGAAGQMPSAPSGAGGTDLAGASGAGSPAPSGASGAGAAGGSPPIGAGGASADPPGTVTIAMDSFSLAPGEEIHKCQNFDNPFGGEDAAVQRIVSDMSPGSHHLHLYNVTVGSGRRLEDCDFTDFHPLVHASGRPHSETIYPAGMAARIRGSQGLRLQVHYLNATASTLTVNASIKLSPVDAATISQWVADLYFNRIGLSVPPGEGQTVSTSCTVPDDYGEIGLISGGSHMHKRGVHFVARTSTGSLLVETDEWEEPPTVYYEPPVMLTPGDAITWACTYDNETGAPITFGESASRNEMCIYLARYYSTSPEATQIECQAYSGSGNVARPNTR